MPHLDLECGDHRVSDGGATLRSRMCLAVAAEEEEMRGNCFSDADEESCNSEFYSPADGVGSYDDFSFACGSDPGEISNDEAAAEDGRVSDFSVDVESGVVGKKSKPHLGEGAEKDCRICHLSLVSSSPGSDVAIELGCSCKDDLAAAHKHCAETWFKIKGNKTCEICNSIACNVVGLNDMEAAAQAASEAAGSASLPPVTAAAAPVRPPASTMENYGCLNGHRFLNFLLACMVFAFIISWLFHFNIPS